MIGSYGISKVGLYHINAGSDVCQDAFYIESVDENIMVAAVADGIGSEKYSDLGSKIAAESAVRYCVDNYQSTEDKSELINHSFRFALDAVGMASTKKALPINQMDSTLCLVILTCDAVFFGNAGDSGAIGLTHNGEYVLLTRSQNDESGRVFPLRYENWDVGVIRDRFVSVLLATDGFYDYLFPIYLGHHDRSNTSFETGVKSCGHSISKLDYDTLSKYIDTNIYRDYVIPEDIIKGRIDGLQHEDSYGRSISDDITVVGIYFKEGHDICSRYSKPIDHEQEMKEFNRFIRNTMGDGSDTCVRTVTAETGDIYAIKDELFRNERCVISSVTGDYNLVEYGSAYQSSSVDLRLTEHIISTNPNLRKYVMIPVNRVLDSEGGLKGVIYDTDGFSPLFRAPRTGSELSFRIAFSLSNAVLAVHRSKYLIGPWSDYDVLYDENGDVRFVNCPFFVRFLMKPFLPVIGKWVSYAPLRISHMFDVVTDDMVKIPIYYDLNADLYFLAAHVHTLIYGEFPSICDGGLVVKDKVPGMPRDLSKVLNTMLRGAYKDSEKILLRLITILESVLNVLDKDYMSFSSLESARSSENVICMTTERPQVSCYACAPPKQTVREVCDVERMQVKKFASKLKGLLSIRQSDTVSGFLNPDDTESRTNRVNAEEVHAVGDNNSSAERYVTRNMPDLDACCMIRVSDISTSYDCGGGVSCRIFNSDVRDHVLSNSIKFMASMTLSPSISSSVEWPMEVIMEKDGSVAGYTFKPVGEGVDFSDILANIRAVDVSVRINVMAELSKLLGLMESEGVRFGYISPDSIRVIIHSREKVSVSIVNLEPRNIMLKNSDSIICGSKYVDIHMLPDCLCSDGGDVHLSINSGRYMFAAYVFRMIFNGFYPMVVCDGNNVFRFSIKTVQDPAVPDQNLFPKNLLQIFSNTFSITYGQVSLISVDGWNGILKDYLVHSVRCKVNSAHVYGEYVTSCPYCRADNKTE